MPNAAKLSQQGQSAYLRAESVRQGIALSGTHLHARLYAAAGRPLPFLLNGNPVAHCDIWDTDPVGRDHPTDRHLRAIAAAGRADVVTDNPVYQACYKEISPMTGAAILADSFSDCDGRDSVGLAAMAFDGFNRDGSERRIPAALSSNFQCVAADDPARFPTLPKAKRTMKDRKVRLTTGGGLAAMPHNYRRITAEEAAKWTQGEQGGYIVRKSRPADDRRDRTGKGCAAKRAAGRAGLQAAYAAQQQT